jgi:hypothetical protein
MRKKEIIIKFASTVACKLMNINAGKKDIYVNKFFCRKCCFYSEKYYLCSVVYQVIDYRRKPKILKRVGILF